MKYFEKSALEAVLFVSGDPLSLIKLSEAIGQRLEETERLLFELQKALEEDRRGIRLIEVHGGWQLVSAPEFRTQIESLSIVERPRLSPALMEGLAIIAYRQPVTRQEIEQIRGVGSDHIVRSLLEAQMIEEKGRKEVVGRPVLYGTTDCFLRTFGLKSTDELPRWEEFHEPEPKVYPEEATEPNEGTTTENHS
jgi:segregation and condensation protein B